MLKLKSEKGLHARLFAGYQKEYLTQAEIDKSNVGKYVSLLDERLANATSKLDSAHTEAKIKSFNGGFLAARKTFMSKLQDELDKLQDGIVKKLSTKTSDVSEESKQGLLEIQNNTLNAVRELAEKLLKGE